MMHISRLAFPSLFALSLAVFSTGPVASEPQTRAKDASAVYDEYIMEELGCLAASLWAEELEHESLYTFNGGRCVATQSLTGTLYSDSSCSQFVTTQEPPSFEDHCANALSNGIGDGNGQPPMVRKWSLSQGTQWDVALPGIVGRKAPFVGRALYRSHHTDLGRCDLEMRVYTSQPGKKQRPAVMVLHGGSWSSRQTGFIGLESMISHLTDRGLLVFMPFYRLAGQEEGPPAACQGATAEEITADTDDAYRWVLANKAQYGASDTPIVTFGQSAGAHLAGWLAAKYPKDINASLLMYPPTDLIDFSEQVLSKQYADADGIEILETFLGENKEQWQPTSNRFNELSIAPKVANLTDKPLLYIIHGLDDGLVPPRQSQLLCEASKGLAEYSLIRQNNTPTTGSTRHQTCGKSRLLLLEGAEHGLEACIYNQVFDIICLAGDADQRQKVRTELLGAYDWLAEQAYKKPAVNEEPDTADSTDTGDDNTAEEEGDSSLTNTATSKGGGSLSIYSLLLLLLAQTFRYRRDDRI